MRVKRYFSSGDSNAALRFYQQGITKKEKDKQHDQRCMIGLARCFIRVGDMEKSEKHHCKSNSNGIVHLEA
jgi:hypothetical protein